MSCASHPEADVMWLYDIISFLDIIRYLLGSVQTTVLEISWKKGPMIKSEFFKSFHISESQVKDYMCSWWTYAVSNLSLAIQTNHIPVHKQCTEYMHETREKIFNLSLYEL